MSFAPGSQNPHQDGEFFHRPNIYAEYDPETGLFGNPQFYATKNEAVEQKKTKMQRVNEAFGLEFATSFLISI